MLVADSANAVVYGLFVTLGMVAGVVVVMGLSFYRSRRRLYEAYGDYWGNGITPARGYWPGDAPSQLIIANPRPVQPITPPASLRSKITHSILHSPFKSTSQQVIDSLKPECVQEYRGKLNFSLSFDSESNTLYLHILEAIELAARDLNGLSDPYVVAFFLEDRGNCKRTHVHRRTLNPKFQEILAFPGRYQRNLLASD
ncbi:SNT-6 protein [Aphelenchoides avenae]|nr:SNT-6 protein [Aphelenchus avenae]